MLGTELPTKRKRESRKEREQRKQTEQRRAQETHHRQLQAKRKTKKWPKRKAIVGIVIAVLIIISYSAWQYYIQLPPSTDNNPSPTGSAPSFSIGDINGTQFSLAQFSGNVIVLHFMTVRCQGQIYPINDHQLQQLKQICGTYCGDKPVTTVTVAASTCSDENLAQIRSSYGITWVLGNDYADGKMDIFEAYTSHEIQDGSIILIDRIFNVAKVYTETITAEALSSKIDQLLEA